MHEEALTIIKKLNKYILEKKYDESIIENATIYQMSYY